MASTRGRDLTTLGSFIRAARIAKRIPQVQVARAAGVSRQQLDGLERGRNVSVKFLLKVANYLELKTLPLDANVRLASGAPAADVVGLLETLDLMAALIDRSRDLAVNAVMPQSERDAELTDVPALRDFVARHIGDADGLTHLGEAFVKLSEEPSAAMTHRPPAAVESESIRRAKKSR